MNFDDKIYAEYERITGRTVTNEQKNTRVSINCFSDVCKIVWNYYSIREFDIAFILSKNYEPESITEIVMNNGYAWIDITLDGLLEFSSASDADKILTKLKYG